MIRASLRLFLVAAVAPSILAANLPPGLASTRFCGPDLTPSPACLSVAPTGEVFVGVDELGSLGKGPGKGRVVRLVDRDGDGRADEHTIFASIDNPRGLIALGDRLWILHTVIPESTGVLQAMHLSVLEDRDRDGVADGPPRLLVSDVSPPKHNRDRGADHTTNGIRMGIDGWIYVAVGDFGVHGARGTDGTELTMLGGGIVRVRPDGSELEVYTHGLRNIYDMAIDPFMNLFTRGNTNDGGGWNVRFIHQVQSGEYGYPVLFKRFTEEIIPALADVGGGSGTGALYFQEPGWPERYDNVPMMCDWGRSQIIIHRVTADGPSFTQEPEPFIQLHQVTDIDVDGSGRLYASAWAGAGYSGSPDKGFIERIVPQGWEYRPFPDPAGLDDRALVALLRSSSATARLAASRELVGRPAAARAVNTLAARHFARLEARVAAIFTLKQMLGARANPALIRLSRDPTVREWALRALADRRTQLEGVSKRLFTTALRDRNPRVQVAAAVALGRLGDVSAAAELLAVANPSFTGTPAEEPLAPAAFQTEPFNGHATVPIDVDVRDFDELFLVTTNGGDGNGEDHTAWFHPRFEDAAGGETPLSSLTWKSAESEWGQNGFGISPTGAPLATGDGQAQPDGLGTHAFSVIVFEVPEGAARFRAEAGLASTSKAKGMVQFFVSGSMPAIPDAKASEGPHATPNAEVILPHVAVKSLIDLRAIDACFDAVGRPNQSGALWALSKMHDVRTVDGLIDRYPMVAQSTRTDILRTLIRLHHREAPYDGSWWWSTRPDTRGPYYKPIRWDGSAAIGAFVRSRFEAGEHRDFILRENARVRADIDGIEPLETKPAVATRPYEPKVDLDAIARAQGQVGEISIEDVILAINDVKGDPKLGAELFISQGCIACHTTTEDQPAKGPYMGQVGAILSRTQIAESILKPNASISQGFASVYVTTRSGQKMTGFITASTADQIELRDIAGQSHRFATADIATTRELDFSLMPPGLANALSIEEFAALLSYLEGMKG